MTRLRYRCLVLDHDDTTVDSTAHVHFPSFLASMAQLRPGLRMTLEEYFAINSISGMSAYFRDTLHLDEAETAHERENWLGYAAAHTPDAYTGMRELMQKQRALGGKLCVVSHNLRVNILRDYQANDLPEPDLIYGSDLPEDRQKPGTFPIEDLLARLQLQPSDVLVVDDLIPGHKMAAAGGVDFAAACWAHRTPQVQQYMETAGVRCFWRVEDLADYLFIE